MVFRSKLGAVSNLNWFPGHMATARKQIQAQLQNVDLVLEVRDARLPFSSSNPLLEELCQCKPRLVLFNKADLANSNLQRKVGDELHKRSNVESIFTMASTKSKNLKHVIEWCSRHSPAQFQSTGGTVILIMGMPNVGKSSLINHFRRLATTTKYSSGRARALVGSTPGVTRRTDMIRINERPALFVIDTPGVMIPKLESTELGLDLALTGAIKDSIVGVEVLAEYMLYVLNCRMKSTRYVTSLNLDRPTDDIEVLFEKVVRKSGGVGKSDDIQRERAAKYLLNEFRMGKFGMFTLDPLP